MMSIVSLVYVFVVEQMTVSVVTRWTEDSLRFGGLLAKSLAGRARPTLLVKNDEQDSKPAFVSHHQ